METFEGFDQLARLGPQLATKFLVAVLCGGAIGMERETSGKPAGLRTNILICLGSTLFTAMSAEMAHLYGGDGGRIAAQIVSGIGFLGAGAILHRSEGGVKGMTTASLIWLMAAIGVLIGSGYPILALVFTLATVLMILLLRPLETYINNRQARDYVMELQNGDDVRRNVRTLLDHYDDFVREVTVTDEGTTQQFRFRFVGPASERRELLEKLYRLGAAPVGTFRDHIDDPLGEGNGS